MEQNKIKPNDVILMMLQALNDDKKEKVYEIAENYYKTTSTNGNFHYRAKRLISTRPVKMLLSNLDNHIKRLIEQRNYSDECVFLDDQLTSFINSLIHEWEHKEVFRSHNLDIRRKILLHGPTGNGKTTIARHIAKLANLPFVEVNSDMIIDSHLGSTGQNIKKLFDSIQESCVLFWDEVDSIGKARGISKNSADFENDRMVNSILINIEKLEKDVVFIGATNRMDVMDPAFIRRFDVKHEICEPTLFNKRNFALMLSDYYKVPLDIPDISRFKSLSEIKTYIIGEARRHVLEVIEANNKN